MDVFTLFDQNFLLWIQSLRQDWMTPFWKAVTFLGNAGWFWILLALLLLFWKQTRKTGMAALLALMVGALITNVWIKPAVARPRPGPAGAGHIYAAAYANKPSPLQKRHRNGRKGKNNPFGAREAPQALLPHRMAGDVLRQV